VTRDPLTHCHLCAVERETSKIGRTWDGISGRFPHCCNYLLALLINCFYHLLHLNVTCFEQIKFDFDLI